MKTESTQIASYGGGINSTAMLIECVKRKEPLTLILFADTGGERPHTYTYIEMFSAWLQKEGYPRIETVKKGGMYLSLEDECIKRKSLPSIAYGFKTCSQKWKIYPQDQHVKKQVWAKDLFSRGDKITKLIGFDADEHHRAKAYSDDKFIVRYPLVEWGIGRDECAEIIKNEGLCLSGKSACFFCPSSRPPEIESLNINYPDLARRALDMEKNADLTNIKGLGRRFSWDDLLSNAGMFDDDFRDTPEMACGCYDG